MPELNGIDRPVLSFLFSINFINIDKIKDNYIPILCSS